MPHIRTLGTAPFSLVRSLVESYLLFFQWITQKSCAPERQSESQPYYFQAFANSFVKTWGVGAPSALAKKMLHCAPVAILLSMPLRIKEFA